jgi:hypothetical protein
MLGFFTDYIFTNLPNIPLIISIGSAGKFLIFSDMWAKDYYVQSLSNRSQLRNDGQQSGSDGQQSKSNCQQSWSNCQQSKSDCQQSRSNCSQSWSNCYKSRNNCQQSRNDCQPSRSKILICRNCGILIETKILTKIKL